ncbi:MAG: beta-aspartyl-dipeptidase (metallo-type), partial [Alteromonadaceae bacterium]
ASDADVVLLDKETLTPEYVWANGTLMVQNTHAVIKGVFE